MVAQMPLSKVRVLELCRRCGTTPQAFYYHFHDKYELVARMYLQDSLSAGTQGERYSPQALERANRSFQKGRSFYRRYYSERVQNSIADYLFESAIEIGRAAMAKAGVVMTRGQELAVRYHCYGIVGTATWPPS